ncbi:hypothetical protein O5478_18540 [Escherichia coli]|nr:hypothetical protein [Escherichia coli]
MMMMDETWVLFSAMNGNRAEMGPEAAGIAASSDDVQSSRLSYGELCHDGSLLPSAGLRPAASGMQRHYAHHRLNGAEAQCNSFPFCPER